MNALKEKEEQEKSLQAKAALGQKVIVTQQDIEKAQAAQSKFFRETIKWIRFYPVEVVQKYPMTIEQSQKIPEKNVIASKGIAIITEVVKWSMKIFNVVGIVFLLYVAFYKKNKEQHIPAELLLMASFFTFLVISSLVLPFISTAYNIERLYAQALFVLVIPILLGGLFLFRSLSERWRYPFLTTLFVYYFLFYTGIIAQFTGGTAI
jgi:uncharacterized membrane protein